MMKQETFFLPAGMNGMLELQRSRGGSSRSRGGSGWGNGCVVLWGETREGSLRCHRDIRRWSLTAESVQYRMLLLLGYGDEKS